jgi:hypothetical protein
VLGQCTGYAIGGDYSGRGLLLCQPEDEGAVIDTAVAALVDAGMHSIHLRMVPQGDDLPRLRSLAVKYLHALTPGDRMYLGASFEEFLGTMGKHTRRNIRNFIRKTAEAGIEFVSELTEAEYAEGVRRLNAETDFPAGAMRLARDERLLALHGGGQRLGLRDANGKLVSVLCGFRQGHRFHVLTQLNDVNLQHLSLSLVLRGLTVQHLISTGHRELQFMGGASLSFGRFCQPEEYRSILIDREHGWTAWAKSLGVTLVAVLEHYGRPIPDKLEMLCGGFLDYERLKARTVLKPAAVAFVRASQHHEDSPLPSTASRPTFSMAE